MIDYEMLSVLQIAKMDIYVYINERGNAEIHNYSLKGREYMKANLISYRNLEVSGNWDPEYSDPEVIRICHKAIDDGLHVEFLTGDKLETVEGSPVSKIPGINLYLAQEDAEKMNPKDVIVLQHNQWPENRKYIRRGSKTPIHQRNYHILAKV